MVADDEGDDPPDPVSITVTLGGHGVDAGVVMVILVLLDGDGGECEGECFKDLVGILLPSPEVGDGLLFGSTVVVLVTVMALLPCVVVIVVAGCWLNLIGSKCDILRR